MLTRAAQRRQALRLVNHAADNIQLPWLCPALSRSSTVITQTRPTKTRPRLTPSSRTVSQSSVRSLASAASIDDFDNGDDYLPFSYERQRDYTRAPPDSLGQLVLSKLLYIDHTTAEPPPKPEKGAPGHSLSGTTDVESSLETCLQVQDWDRAFSLLAQIRQENVTDLPKLQQVYNRVLEAMVFDLIWNRNNENKARINNWIEVDMRAAGIDPTAQTFALKIKAALATLEGPKRNRTVRRYWNFAKDYQFENHVASLRNILSDNDLGKLMEICPQEIDPDMLEETAWEEPEFVSQQVAMPHDTFASIRETEQKGLGLVTLRRALSLFTDPFKNTEPSPADMEAQKDIEAQLRQSKLEQDSLDAAVTRWKAEHEKRMKMGVSGGFTQGKIGSLLWQWHELLSTKIKNEIALIEQAERQLKPSIEDRQRLEYAPHLRSLSPQQLAAVTTLAVVQLMSKLGISQHIKLARMVIDVGRSVESEIQARQLQVQKSQKQSRTKSQTDVSQDSVELSHDSPKLLRWSVDSYAKVGAVLCGLLFDVAKMTVSEKGIKEAIESSSVQPVFQRHVIHRKGRAVNTVLANEAFQELICKEPAADLIAKQLPMISKPRPWTGFSEGGYLQSYQPVLRVKHSDITQADYAKAAAARGDLDQMYAGLDVLGSTAWNINKDVFGVMRQAWNSGEAIANLPPINKVFPEMTKPGDDASTMERWAFFNKLRTIENEKGGLHSNRCFQNFQMEIAQAYLDETFYLPHNVDFRGRAYPIPPYLNQMGADNARGLLLFAKGRELGAVGLRWLQIQLANVFGFDKASLSDRAKFAMDHIDDIRDSVANPLTGRRWWLKAEDPWQCLAACFELDSALKLDDPTKFVSRLPVHQDGSCNGLQHYAALGGDIAGARQVNLEPGDKPADVYTGVAELVRAEIKKDVADGVEIAKALDGRIARKIVKQTVMTNVYGVTFTGAIRQVRKQVDDLLPDLVESGQASQASTYIARKIFQGLGTLFNGAHEIQYWLGDCANRITHSISPAQMQQIVDAELKGKTDSTTKEADSTFAFRPRTYKKQTAKQIDTSNFRSTVVWTTPLNLPVVQPYRVSHSSVVQTSLSNLSLIEPSIIDAVDPRKQLQGFPPNFIHSLDATHMMLSAIKANEIGISFSAVHDSFWTHAADVDTLNILLRDAFIRMHSEDIVGRLAAEFRARYSGHFYLAHITKSNVLAREISKYRQDLAAACAQAKTKMRGGTSMAHKKYQELAREGEKARLLASEYPEERARGEAMVTAASIFAKHNGEKYLASTASLGQTAKTDNPSQVRSGRPKSQPVEVQEALDISAESNFDLRLKNTAYPLPKSDVVDSAACDADVAEVEEAERAKDLRSMWLWLPLTFKDVPKRGDWDVTRLKDSTYFFS